MGRTEVARVLVEGGADLSAKDSPGETPLKHATEHNHADVIELLKGSRPRYFSGVSSRPGAKKLKASSMRAPKQ